MEKFALTIPGLSGTPVQTPPGIPTGPNAFQNSVQLLVEVIFVFAILLAFGFMTWAGIRMIIHGSKKEEVAKVRGMLADIVIGLSMVFLAFLLIRGISYFFGIDLLPLDK